MKKNFITPLLGILLFANIQLHAGSIHDSKNRTLPKFSSVKLAISANVYLTQSNTQSLKIEASDKLTELIETVVKNGQLTIKWSKNNVHHSEKIKIYISMKEVTGLAISGSGDIIADNKINTDKIDLAISGSGNISLQNLNANDIKSKISGSADIKIAGTQTASRLSIAISGSGDVKASGLLVKNVKIKISGSGNCKVNVSGQLDAAISGSGDVYYKGQPIINGKVAGSGKIKSIE